MAKVSKDFSFFTSRNQSLPTSRSLVVFFSIIMLSPALRAASTPDYWKCASPVGGSFTWGQVPNGCDTSGFLDEKLAAQKYKEILFIENQAGDQERTRYMGKLYPVIRDAANLFLQARKPTAVVDEQVAWRRLVFACAHQESFWSHYRIFTQDKLKMTRGDRGHGHGLMQIDDRAHFDLIQAGVGADFVQNLKAGMDELFVAWEKASSASCLKPTEWTKRARSSYSAYNGGISQLCRWTDSWSRWRKNDQNFLQKYQAQEWERGLDPNQKAPFDVGCFMREKTCEVPTTEEFKTDSEGRTCWFKANSSVCVDSPRDRVCLSEFAKRFQGLDIDFSSMNSERFYVCEKIIPGLVRPLSWVRIENDLALSVGVDHGAQQLVSKSEALQVIDFEIREIEQKLSVVYFLQNAKHRGYVRIDQPGQLREISVTVLSTEESRSGLATTGERVRVVRDGGIRLRESVGGKILAVVPKGQIVKIEGYQLTGADQAVAIEVSYQNQTGFIYAGHLRPEVTQSLWVKREGDKAK